MKDKTKNHNNRAAKKQAVLGTSPKPRIPLAVVLPLILVFFDRCRNLLVCRPENRFAFERDHEPPAAGATAVQTDVVSHPVNLFEDGKAHYFSFRSNGLAITYFVLKSSDGVLRAAFDACDVCWRAGKGYAQDGDDMVCRNCGRRFSSLQINTVQGGCNPAPLRRTVEEDRLIIKVEDILQGKSYFNS